MPLLKRHLDVCHMVAANSEVSQPNAIWNSIVSEIHVETYDIFEYSPPRCIEIISLKLNLFT